MQKVDEFLANEAKGTKVIGARSLEEMVTKLKKPRRVMLLVKAGSAVDDFIQKLVSILVLFLNLVYSQCYLLQCLVSIAYGSVHCCCGIMELILPPFWLIFLLPSVL